MFHDWFCSGAHQSLKLRAWHTAAIILIAVWTAVASGSFDWSSSPPLLVSSSLWVCGRAYHQGSAGSPDWLAQAESLSAPFSSRMVGLHSASAAHPPETRAKTLLRQLFQQSEKRWRAGGAKQTCSPLNVMTKLTAHPYRGRYMFRVAILSDWGWQHWPLVVWAAQYNAWCSISAPVKQKEKRQ